MITSFNQLKKQIDFETDNKISLGLDRMTNFLEKLGDPHLQIKAIHIGGTNGKGSTVKYLEGMLSELGLTIGVFHSPAYQYINDQITVNGKEITDKEMIHIIDTFNNMGLKKSALTEFELLTAMALYYFAVVKKVNFALVEVGLGGREDSTNVITPILSIITNVGYDHVGFLGESLEEIAHHKAGIIKAKVPVISAEGKEEAQKVLDSEAETKQSPIFFLEKDFHILLLDNIKNGEIFTFSTSNTSIKNVRIVMQGEHQARNASLALMGYLNLVEQGHIARDDGRAKMGLEKARHPGRFEVIQSDPTIILDGAHNTEAIDALAHLITKKYAKSNVIVLFSALKDKPLENMIGKLEEIADEIIFTSFEFPRAAKAIDLFVESQHADKTCEGSWEKALKNTIPRLQNNSVFLITGSLYFISEIRTYLTEELKKK